jgi:ATP-dependent exoDNAse (exonuclease V) alpha subunit
MKGFTSMAQPQSGDKIICLKNYWDIYSRENGTPLINGTTGELAKVRMQTEKDIYIDFSTDYSEDVFKNIRGDLCPFNGATRLVPKWKKSKEQDPVLFDYGYAITVHKSQGSQYNKVLLFEEVLNSANHKRWLYTGATRAVDKLVIVKA